MNVFVTGGAGYIGSITVEELLKAGHRVTVYDNLSKGHRQAVPPDAAFIQGDIGDRAALDAALRCEHFDAVMHFAALIEPGESMKEPGKYFRNNVANSLTLIEAAIAAGVSRFVFSSTCAVYASQDAPIREDAPIAPANVYGHTKRMIEEMLAWFHRLKGLRYAALRYFNAAGATAERGEAHEPEIHLIPRVLKVALGQLPHVGIYGTDYPTPDGTCIRDYIHIVDLAQAHLLALEALDERGELIYNLGNGAGYSVRQVIEVAREVTGHPIPAVEMPRRPGDAPRLVASAEKARRELGWAPRTPALRDIIASAWAWHRTHPDGYA
ncbi:MAG: UDP-glucose 4-epimerase GalE [Chloroflexota bacterium]